MKKISLILGGMMLIGMSATASAAKPTDIEIMHCGCNAAGTGLEMHAIIVNSNGGGHHNHTDGSVTECNNTTLVDDGLGGEIELGIVEITRTQSDCQVSDVSHILRGKNGPLEQCGDVVAVVCGTFE